MNFEQLFAPYSPPDTNLVDRLSYWGQHTPDAIAYYYLVDGEEEEEYVTYGELDRRASAIAAKLAAIGMRGERALLLYPPGLDFICGFFGCMYAGAIPVPAYPPRRNRNMNRIEAIADDAQAKVALTVASVLGRVADTLESTPRLQQLTWLATDDLSEKLADECPPLSVADESVAFLQYTSGSTGTPKGVVITHRNLMNNCRLIATAFDFTRSGCGASWLPCYHDMGLLGGVLTPMFYGRYNVLFSPMAFLLKPVRWLRAIDRYSITMSGGPNFAYALCNEKITDEECEGLDLNTWDLAFNGAEPVRAETMEAFTRKFAPYGFRAETHYPCYGMAESTLFITGGYKNKPPVVKAFDNNALAADTIKPMTNGTRGGRKLVGCGHARTNEELIIVDPETCTKAPQDRVGEIWVRGPSIGQGYWNKPEISEEVFQAKLNDGSNGSGWLRTGDLGFVHQQELYVTGRLKDLIIIRGVNRYPQDIELTVENTDGVLRSGCSAAFALDVENQERLVVVCEVERRGEAEWDTVIESIRRNVTNEHELPPDAVVLVRVGAIPKTSSGKTQRHACRDAFTAGELLVVAQWVSWDQAAAQHVELKSSETQPVETPAQDVNPQIVKFVMDEVRRVGKERAADLDLESNIVSDVGLDSLERLEVAHSLENTFGGRFPDHVLQKVETCRQVALAVEEYIGSEPVFGLRASGKSTTNGNGKSHAEIPAAYYELERFPEFVRLQQTRRMLAATGVREPFFNLHEGTVSNTTKVNDRVLVNFASCNYLGLSGDPKVNEAAKKAIDEFGTSVSATRILSGERSIHPELESELAEFLGTQDALTFVGSHATNETIMGHLLGNSDLVLHDSRAHSSIVKGAELSGARRRSFEHNNPDDVERILSESREQYRRVLIAIEGLYDLEADFPDVRRFIEIKNRHKAMLLVDEAHTFGTMGMFGRGVQEHFRIDPADVELWTGSLANALGSCGGYVAAKQEVIEYLRFTAPGFVFATGISPANAAAALAALRCLRAEPARVANLHSNGRLFHTLVKQHGLRTGDQSGIPVIPVFTRSSFQALQLAERLFERGINAQPVIHPAVHEERTQVRFFVTSMHTEEQIRETVETVASEFEQFDESVEEQAPVQVAQ